MPGRTTQLDWPVVNPIRQAIEGLRPLVRLRRAIRGPRRPSWSLELETIAEVLRHGAGVSILLPLAWQRRVIDPPRPKTGPMRETTMERITAGGVPAEWFSREDSDASRVIIYLHGGGYSVGSIDSHRDFLSRLCSEAGCRILAVEYRLAPEHRFPTPIDDCVAAYQWLLNEGIAPERIAIGGESAGGGLTLATLLTLRDSGQPLPAAGVLLSAWLDLAASGASMRVNDPYDYLTANAMRVYAQRYVSDRDLKHPLASPVYADLHGIPPLLIQVGGAEMLLDDSLRLADRAKEAGVRVELEVWNDMIHAFQMFAPIIEDGIGRSLA